MPQVFLLNQEHPIYGPFQVLETNGPFITPTPVLDQVISEAQLWSPVSSIITHSSSARQGKSTWSSWMLRVWLEMGLEAPALQRVLRDGIAAHFEAAIGHRSFTKGWTIALLRVQAPVRLSLLLVDTQGLHDGDLQCLTRLFFLNMAFSTQLVWHSNVVLNQQCARDLVTAASLPSFERFFAAGDENRSLPQLSFLLRDAGMCYRGEPHNISQMWPRLLDEQGDLNPDVALLGRLFGRDALVYWLPRVSPEDEDYLAAPQNQGHGPPASYQPISREVSHALLQRLFVRTRPSSDLQHLRSAIQVLNEQQQNPSWVDVRRLSRITELVTEFARGFLEANGAQIRAEIEARLPHNAPDSLPTGVIVERTLAAFVATDSPTMQQLRASLAADATLRQLLADRPVELVAHLIQATLERQLDPAIHAAVVGSIREKLVQRQAQVEEQQRHIPIPVQAEVRARVKRVVRPDAVFITGDSITLGPAEGGWLADRNLVIVAHTIELRAGRIVMPSCRVVIKCAQLLLPADGAALLFDLSGNSGSVLQALPAPAPAPSGASWGQSGTNGIPGTRGQNGANGGSFRACVATVAWPGAARVAQVFIKTNGQNGGNGQGGGAGGSGHAGAPGADAPWQDHSWISGGAGQAGGNGAVGGSGGNGGKGGDSGDIQLQTFTAEGRSCFSGEYQPSTGGAGGPGGQGGQGGAGGAGGLNVAQKWKNTWKTKKEIYHNGRSSAGASGQNGAHGESGQHGANGQSAVYALTDISSSELLSTLGPQYASLVLEAIAELFLQGTAAGRRMAFERLNHALELSSGLPEGVAAPLADFRRLLEALAVQFAEGVDPWGLAINSVPLFPPELLARRLASAIEAVERLEAAANLAAQQEAALEQRRQVHLEALAAVEQQAAREITNGEQEASCARQLAVQVTETEQVLSASRERAAARAIQAGEARADAILRQLNEAQGGANPLTSAVSIIASLVSGVSGLGAGISGVVSLANEARQVFQPVRAAWRASQAFAQQLDAAMESGKRVKQLAGNAAQTWRECKDALNEARGLLAPGQPEPFVLVPAQTADAMMAELAAGDAELASLLQQCEHLRGVTESLRVQSREAQARAQGCWARAAWARSEAVRMAGLIASGHDVDNLELLALLTTTLHASRSEVRRQMRLYQLALNAAFLSTAFTEVPLHARSAVELRASLLALELRRTQYALSVTNVRRRLALQWLLPAGQLRELNEGRSVEVCLALNDAQLAGLRCVRMAAGELKLLVRSRVPAPNVELRVRVVRCGGSKFRDSAGNCYVYTHANISQTLVLRPETEGAIRWRSVCEPLAAPAAGPEPGMEHAGRAWTVSPVGIWTLQLQAPGNIAPVAGGGVPPDVPLTAVVLETTVDYV